MLNEGQKAAKELVDAGGNVLVTGAGGVGKSFLMRAITTKDTILCAPTGAAALQIGGVTNSSLFGLPLGVCLDSDQFKIAKKLEGIFAEGKIDRIIMDEVSMVRSDQLSLIDARLRKVTRVDKPFGGVQMVFVGDFYQLPPIVGQKEKKVFYERYKSPWVMDSPSWEMANIQVVHLTEVMRQEDAKQQAILEAIRTKNKFWGKAVERINEISIQRPLDAVWLCSYNKTVDMMNNTRYQEIKGPEKTYKAINNNFKPRDMPVAEVIKLKVGAKVLIKANHPEGEYVNGTQGVVIGFKDGGVLVKTTGGAEVFVEPFSWDQFDYVMGFSGLTRKKVASFTQIPIKLGWAISTHGSQGCTLDAVNIDFGRRGTFAEGQAYVALSRVKDLTKMYIQNGLTYQDIKVSERVQEFYKEGK